MRKKKLILISAVLILSGVALGQTPAEERSDVRPGLMPGNPLYAVEGFVEGLEVRLAGAIGGSDLKSKAIANNAEERLAEARHLADKNKTEQAGKAMQKYLKGINQSKNIARESENNKLEEQIQNVSNKNRKALEEVEKKVPPQAKEAIRKAQEKSDKQSQKPDKKPENKSKTPESAEKGLNKSKEIDPSKKKGALDRPKSRSEQTNRANISDAKPADNKSNLTEKPSFGNETKEKEVDKTSNKTEKALNKTQRNRDNRNIDEMTQGSNSNFADGSGSKRESNSSDKPGRDFVG